MKTCRSCNIRKDEASFHKSTRAKSGTQTYCKSCTKAMSAARPDLCKARGERYRAKNPAESLYRHLAKRARLNAAYCIDRQGFCDWYYKQPMQCEYCGESQDNARALYGHKLHIDRKIGTIGYRDGNMVLACQRCNLIKNGYLTHQQMMEIAGRYFNGPYGNAHEELLEALKRLQSVVRDEYHLLDIRKRPSLCLADAQAGTAIAKAEGRA